MGVWCRIATDSCDLIRNHDLILSAWFIFANTNSLYSLFNRDRDDYRITRCNCYVSDAIRLLEMTQITRMYLSAAMR